MGRYKKVGSRLVRPAYRSEDYTAPPDVADEIRAWNPTSGSASMWNEEHHGPFMGLNVHAIEDRDGRRWMTLWQPVEGWAIEVELTDAPPFAIHVLPTDEAWRIAREWDARANPPIDVEPQPALYRPAAQRATWRANPSRSPVPRVAARCTFSGSTPA
jgi:hypothetical protein